MLKPYPLPNTEDQIDVIYSVEEETTGSIGGNIGYSDFGFMLGFNLQEQNFLGSGNTVGIGISKNIYSESYNISFLDPYATKDAVSLGYNYISEKPITENLMLPTILVILRLWSAVWLSNI